MLLKNILPKNVTILLVLFILVLLVGFFALKKPGLEYKLSTGESIRQMQSGAWRLSTEQLKSAITDKNSNIQFIDTRDPYTFVKGHINGAENIYLQDLMSHKNLMRLHQFLEDSVRVVVYGNDEASVNGLVQMLRQSGYGNILSMEGGYPAYLAIKEGRSTDSIPGSKAEASRYDYKSYLKQITSAEKASPKDVPAKVSEPKKIKPVRSSNSGEGC